MENPFRTELDIFNGRFKLITEENEFRMSHWVKGFGITDNTSGEEVLPLTGSFNLDKLEEIGNCLKISFQIYPIGSVTYEVEINPFERTFLYENETQHLEHFVSTFRSKTKD